MDRVSTKYSGSNCNYMDIPSMGDQIYKSDHICKVHTGCSRNIRLAPAFENDKVSVYI